MARFYDSVNEYELQRVEWSLLQGGVEYSLRILQEKPLLKEILVAEEDLAFAETLLGYGPPQPGDDNEQ